MWCLWGVSTGIIMILIAALDNVFCGDLLKQRGAKPIGLAVATVAGATFNLTR